METIFIYLLKSSCLVAVFFVAYNFLLKKETFFQANRWFLIFGLVASIVLPLIKFQKIIFIESSSKNTDWVSLPTQIQTQPESFQINWFIVLGSLYIIGILIFLIQFAIEFKNLNYILKGKIIQQQADYKLIDISENIAPFSFFNNIVFNSSLYQANELENILHHEKIHCEQNHTIDVIFSRFFCIFFWYNPFVWYTHKAILQNLEFIADSEALKKITDKKAYQFTLLKVTTHVNCVAITNNFYQSLIKKRIVMLNKNQSEQWNSWKYFLIIPVLAAFMFYFQVNVIAQERNTNLENTTKNSKETIEVVVDKNTSDAQLQQEARRVKEQHGIKLKFSKIKRNSSGEIIAIKAEYKDLDGKQGTTQVKSDEPIEPLVFFKNDNGALGFGNGKNAKNKSFHFSINTDGNEEDTTEIQELAEAPEAPEPPEAPETPESINNLIDKKIIITNHDDSNGKMSITINGETIDIDTDKILAEVETEINKLDLDKITSEALENASIEIRRNKPTKKIIKSIIRESKEQSERDRAQIKYDVEQSENDIKQAIEDNKQAKIEIEKSNNELVATKKALEASKKELEAYKKKMAKK